jgi:hypothetical protein
MTDNASTPSTTAQPPLIGGPPSASSAPIPGSAHARQPVAILLNLCLGLFLADALVSWLDDSSILLFDVEPLKGIRGILLTFTLLTTLIVYALMGLTPLIPKRVFLPVTLINPISLLLIIPGLIYFYSHVQHFAWIISTLKVLLGVGVLRYLQGGFKFRWPLVPESMLGSGRFSWRRLCVFLLVNFFAVLPGALAYLVACGSLAVNRFSEGFVALRPAGFTVQVRKYVRNDGKTVLLVPMSHVGEPDFYHSLAEGFAPDSAILMEGVTDDQNLLTNRITYKRMATSLGLAPQEKQFKPNPTQIVPADIDVDQFTTNTIAFLNLVMLVHSQGINLANVLRVLEYPEPPNFEEQLFGDLLKKRNRHLLQVIQNQLSQANNLIVPWGAAHMPEIAREIQKSGFRLATTRDYVAIRFGKHRRAGQNARSDPQQ